MDELRHFKKIYELVLKMQNSIAGMTKQEIADFLDCSFKTVERKVMEIESLFGDAFITNKGYPKLYKIRSKKIPSNIRFLTNEISAVRSAVDLLRKQNRLSEADTLSLLAEKITAVTQYNDSRNADFLMNLEGNTRHPVPHKKIQQEIVDKIKEALIGGNPVEMEYFPKKTMVLKTYKLYPYGLLYGDRNHYLLAKSAEESKNAPVCYFIISNIQSLNILKEEHYTLPLDFSISEYTKNLFGMYNEPPFEVEWLFSPKVAKEAKNFIFHPSQTMEELEDGSLKVSFFAGGALEMAWHLYTWNDEVTVLKPTDFWERVEKAKKEWF